MGIQNNIDNMSKGKGLIENFDEKTREIMVEWTENKILQTPFRIIHFLLISVFLTMVYKMLNVVLGKWLNMENKNNQILNLILTIISTIFFILFGIDKELELGIFNYLLLQ
ncbi:hypothetical protein [Sulfurimonas sp.]|uniref:hypothetical protein n=1 Tax=Sulfurimonas sp. TaxID=2022749 RepID=UPI0025D83AAF|nr:hypothetical protein [Sulfurimonas sp.]MBW6488443.1 hypothetical protein [Sulfurimonas sp.]